jgi:hypothetical protein
VRREEGAGAQTRVWIARLYETSVQAEGFPPASRLLAAGLRRIVRTQRLHARSRRAGGT